MNLAFRGIIASQGYQKSFQFLQYKVGSPRSATKPTSIVHFVLIVLDKNFKLLYLMIRIEDFVDFGSRGIIASQGYQKRFQFLQYKVRSQKSATKPTSIVHYVLIVLDKIF
jgi:hypothetical protein